MEVYCHLFLKKHAYIKHRNDCCSCTDAWWTSVVSIQMSIRWKQVQVWRENQHEMANGFTDLVFKCAIDFRCDIFYRIDSIGLVFRICLCPSLHDISHITHKDAYKCIAIAIYNPQRWEKQISDDRYHKGGKCIAIAVTID
eukprot:467359_1